MGEKGKKHKSASLCVHQILGFIIIEKMLNCPLLLFFFSILSRVSFFPREKKKKPKLYIFNRMFTKHIDTQFLWAFLTIRDIYTVILVFRQTIIYCKVQLRIQSSCST